MKILALDIGDVWTGTALSDSLGMFAKPYITTKTEDLTHFLSDIFAKESIDTVVVGHPKTLRGTQSDQTKKVEEMAQELGRQFPQLAWVLWDERFSSKQADQLKRAKTKEEKIQSHSLAAAFILSSYLDFRHIQKNSSDLY